MSNTSLGLTLSLATALGCSSGLTVGSVGSGGIAATMSGGGPAAGSRPNGDTGGVADGAIGGISGTGATGDTSCAVGNACSPPNSHCVNGNVTCQCSNGLWSVCTITGAGGAGNVSDTSGGATTGTGGACVSADSQAKRVPPVVFFVIDSTGSMRDVPASGSTNGETKWSVLRTVWPEVIGSLPPSWAVGLMLWSCTECPLAAYQPASYPVPMIPIGPLDSAQVTALSNLPASPVGGYTPTECAYDYALEQIQGFVAPPAYANSPRYLVLLTDGVPTVSNDCQSLGAIQAGTFPIDASQYAGLIATVANGTAASGVKTFVAGVPGSDVPQGAPYDPMYMLSLVAAAGGTALPNCTPTAGTVNNDSGQYGTVNPRGTYCHYDLTTQSDFGAALGAALSSIAASLVSCQYAVPAPPPPYVMLSATDVEVIFTTSAAATPLTRAPGDDCGQGGAWYYASYDGHGLPTELDLCPDTCSAAQSDPSAAVSIHFTCLGEV